MSATADFVETVTIDTFDSLVLKSSTPVAVEFMSYGCEHCRLLEPVLQSVAESLGSQVAIARVNIAADQELASRFDIRGTPTLVMFLNGVEVGRAVGPVPTVSGVREAIVGTFDGDARS
ncbi:thioredoxin 1 [Bryocella elongata]|uniref:Thioredoxin 1 n=1 Tax=Bryocella elongata TaxID=863522 RepID=A0A1H5RZG9_9BACT|nr:thioredoxin domain-containing protein [Bryocella elongata]SEF43715.1 thioredoxin 1 [Bryocella elongata]